MKETTQTKSITGFLRKLLNRVLLVLPVSLVIGSLVALFLQLLDVVTLTRFKYNWIIFLLPLAGVGIHFLYKLWGKNSETGNDLIIDEIHQPGGGVPARMTPLVLISTLITHLFGGSAGREGTAVQMGGSIGAFYSRALRLSADDTRIILMAGIAAGFAAVFGTPFAGAIFALEVIAFRSARLEGMLPCIIAALAANWICMQWGIHHTIYSIVGGTNYSGFFSFSTPDFFVIAKSVVGGICFGLAGFAFSWLIHFIKNTANRFIRLKSLIPLFGGLIIIGLCYLAGTRDYLGLGVVSEYPKGISIVSAFVPGGVDNWSWLWKIVFTAVTLGTGFKGGEVTPLFFIGACLGNAVALYTNAPIDLFAALGFIAVFAGATNTPLACTILGVELFGGEYVLYFAVACFTAFYFSGHKGIYSSKHKSHFKMHTLVKKISSAASNKS